MSGNAYGEFLERYGPPAGEEGPVLFAQEVFGATLDGWQEDVLRAYGREERRISIRACHGPGKTFVAALMIIHQILTRFPQHTVATAPSTGQLEGALVKEVLVLYGKLPPLLQELIEPTKNHLALKAEPNASWFTARTARAETPEALQGVHCDEGWVLLIADEASGVPEPIFEAAAGSMSGHRATTLLLSNPVRSSGFFFDTHHKNKAMWYTKRVGAADSTRVSDDYVAYIAGQYGEDSSAYRVRVLGEFPLADADTVIPYEYVESARNRDIVVPPNMKEVWGLDVARFGDDSTALVRRNNLEVLPDIIEVRGQDIMQVTGRVKALWDDLPSDLRPEWIMVDVIGLGAGVVDRLRELKLPVRGVNVSETASSTEEYSRLRDELWFMGRNWLGSRDHKLPRCTTAGGCARECVHEKLAAELVAPTFSYLSNGKRLVESKSDMKKRGYKSPNFADAFLLTFAGPAAQMIYGSKDSKGWHYSWNEPIKRNRSMV